MGPAGPRIQKAMLQALLLSSAVFVLPQVSGSCHVAVL
jgi:hypothetical protein